MYHKVARIPLFKKSSRLAWVTMYQNRKSSLHTNHQKQRAKTSCQNNCLWHIFQGSEATHSRPFVRLSIIFNQIHGERKKLIYSKLYRTLKLSKALKILFWNWWKIGMHPEILRELFPSPISLPYCKDCYCCH